MVWTNVYRAWPTDSPGPWTGLWLECVGIRDMSRASFQHDPQWWCIHVVERGAVRFRLGDGAETVVGEGDLFALWPHVEHEFRAEPADSGGAVRLPWVRPRGPLAGAFMEACGVSMGRPAVRAHDAGGVASLIRRMIGLAESYSGGAETRAVSLLYELAGACAASPPPRGESAPLAHRVREAMERDVAAGRNVEELASAFGVSRSTLFLKFRETFGKSPVEVLIETRLGRARRLLEGSDRSIGEVALASGYGDALYFSRQFRERVGVTPSEYRARGGRI